MLYDPAVLKLIRLTEEQKKGLQRLWREADQRRQQRGERERDDRILALLDPEQVKRLRPEVEQLYHQRREATAEKRERAALGNTTRSGSGTVAVTVSAGNLEVAYSSFRARDAESGEDAQTAYIVLPVYEDLGGAEVRKGLGLSAAQQERLQDIAAESGIKREKSLREERDQGGLQRKLDRLAIESGAKWNPC